MKKNFGSFVIPITIIVSVLILCNTYIAKSRTDDTLMVTGLGKTHFESDLIVWTGRFSQKSMELKWAYAGLSKTYSIIKDYILSMGVDESEIVFSSIDIDTEYKTWYDDNDNYHKEFEGYVLRQDVTIESKKVDIVEKVSREITELITQGIVIYSDSPYYYYTKLEELKLQMIEEAARNARKRAEIIANNSGARLGRLRFSKMGVFQIIGKNSNENYTYGGAFNTSSKEKTATITVKLNYGIK